jgi:hypothetical protein
MPDDAPRTAPETPPPGPVIVSGGRPVFADSRGESATQPVDAESVLPPPLSPARVAGGLAALLVVAGLVFLVAWTLESLRRALSSPETPAAEGVPNPGAPPAPSAGAGG